MSTPLHPDHALVQAALRRDLAAIEWLGERFACIPRIVAKLAWRLGLPSGAVPDWAAEAAATALRRLASYHGLKPLEAWLYRICELTVLGQRRRQHPGEREATVDDLPGTEPSPVDAAAQAEHRQRLEAAVAALGGVEAEVLRLRHFDSLSFRDIAARTGIPLATLRTRYYRGLEKLRATIASTYPFPDADP
jgi:RNA polymerase sigma-70 factor, ECF subfamily